MILSENQQWYSRYVNYYKIPFYVCSILQEYCNIVCSSLWLWELLVVYLEEVTNFANLTALCFLWKLKSWVSYMYENFQHALSMKRIEILNLNWEVTFLRMKYYNFLRMKCYTAIVKSFGLLIINMASEWI